MARRQKAKRPKPKTVLRLPDLEQWKNAVLNSLAAASSQESYGHAIGEFIGWYCSEPRLAFNRTVVLRYRFPGTEEPCSRNEINIRLAAVRRLAYEACDTGILSSELAAGIRPFDPADTCCDTGILSSELAAGIRRVKGAKRLGVRIGNWLTID